jgi:hypothetical protein
MTSTSPAIRDGQLQLRSWRFFTRSWIGVGVEIFIRYGVGVTYPRSCPSLLLTALSLIYHLASRVVRLLYQSTSQSDLVNVLLLLKNSFRILNDFKDLFV